MERLTKRNSDGSVGIAECRYYNYEDFQKLAQKLADYEDFAEIFEKHFSTEALELLSDKEEFSKWLERGRWIAIKCDEINRELQVFKGKQEQGLLISLPVKEGTEVWCIGSCGEICDNWSLDCSNCKEHEVVFYTNFDRNMVEQWGKTVFATEPEAEEALAKMGGSHEL